MSTRKRTRAANSGDENTQFVVKNELDLFSSRANQTSIIGSTLVDIQPVSGTLRNDSPICFHIPANEELFLDPLFYLKITAQIKAIPFDPTKTNSTDHRNVDGPALEKIAPVNLFGHAMFKRIDVKLQDSVITASTDNYPNRAYIEKVLNYGHEAKSTQLSSEMFYPDTAGHFDSLNDAQNTGFGMRRQITLGAKKFVMFVRLSTDISNQARLLPNGVSVDVVLHQSSNQFRLMYESNSLIPTVEFTEAVLFVRRVQLSPPMMNAMAHTLRVHPAKYHISRTVIKEFQITTGRTLVNRETISRGQLPRTVIIGLVESDSFNGRSEKSPFNFVAKKPSFICLYNENEIIPSIPYTPNWDNNDAMREYLGLFKISGMQGRNAGNAITYDNYLSGGYVLYGFDLTPDESTAHNYAIPSRQGELSLKMIFDSDKIDQPCTIVVYLVYDNCIYIDQHRNVVTDFSA